MAFEDTRTAFTQEHFTIIEIDVPVVNGTCTISGEPGYGTPLTCDQASNATKTYRFTDYQGTLPLSDVYKVVESISESPTELQSGRGLAKRGTCSIRLKDFKGDPNPQAPAVTEEVKNSGGFIAKLDARNILKNRELRIKLYRIADGVFPDLDNDAQVRYYLADSLKRSGSDTWTLTGKDELSRVDPNEKLWPPVTNGFLRNDINDSTTTLDVDTYAYTAGMIIRIGDELMRIVSVSNIGSGSAQLTVNTRGSDIGSAPVVSKTIATSHSAGDEIFVCRLYNNDTIQDLLTDVLTDIGIPSARIPSAQWNTELTAWHASTVVNALYVEAMDANDVLAQICQSYMLDMWFDVVSRTIPLSAISVWQTSVAVLEEGNQIDYESITRGEDEELRATAAVVVYGKDYKTDDDSIASYRLASYYNNATLETDDYYGEAKEKRFDNNPIIEKDSGDLLVARWVGRYGLTPNPYSWTTQESKLSFNVGDVVDLRTYAKVGFDGLPSDSARAQITSIQPVYKQGSREYKVRALTYETAFDTSTGALEFVINQDITGNKNLFIHAGAPASATTVTFIFDGIDTGSIFGGTSFYAGNWPAGSKIIIILANGADCQAAGGAGSSGGVGVEDENGIWVTPTPQNGGRGGIVYDAQGVDTDIYFSGATPSSNYPTADGYIRAPGGGGGASKAVPADRGGDAGSGGAGRRYGSGGVGGLMITNDESSLPRGSNGLDGNELGNGGLGVGNGAAGGNWGQAGGDSDSTGGAAGKGVVSGGATVTFYGLEPTRYINGQGDYP